MPTLSSRGRLITALLVLQVLDFSTTQAVLALGGSEANPVMQPIVAAGWATFLAVKILAVAIVALIVHHCPVTRTVQLSLFALTALYVGIVSINLANLQGV